MGWIMFTDEQMQRAIRAQDDSAQDMSDQVRLVAGPGTGKSSTIEKRVCFLLQQGIDPNRIYAVSFTRASSIDLRARIKSYCISRGVPGVEGVRISTLHSLSLHILRAAGLLVNYPAEPLVLDKWELSNIIDSEYMNIHHVGKERSEDIRKNHEAFWSTGVWAPDNYVPPDEPITDAERTSTTFCR
jgi:DNA helicase II / ATP-dependent DNA helicase PcrA